MPLVESTHTAATTGSLSSAAQKAVAALQPAVVRLVTTGPRQAPSADEIIRVLRSFDQRAIHYSFELAYVPLVAILRQSYKTLPEDSTISLVRIDGSASRIRSHDETSGRFSLGRAVAAVKGTWEPALPERRLQSLFPTVTTAVLFPVVDYNSTDKSMPEELARALTKLAHALVKYRRYSPTSSRNLYHVGYTLHLLLNPLRLEGDREGQVMCFEATGSMGDELAREGEDLGQWYPGV
ncbi:hypothetical protein FOZ63_009053, partial [Perkinsus olseni]